MQSKFEKELAGELLASVSRSFFLSIKVLPGRLRAPIALAYLLARTSDTIADSADAPGGVRLAHLGAFAQMIADEAVDGQIRSLQAEIAPPDPAERLLIDKLPRCLDWLASLDAEDRVDIVDVLKKIIHGQELDVARFGAGASVIALETAEELDEYTYLVAGCVGEFWTRVCFRHIGNYATVDRATMSELGVNFGKGLQLVNVLRDLPADLKAGRCYLPAQEFTALGLTVASLRNSPRECRPILDRWISKAGKHLDDAFHYIERVSPWRLRYACVLPWYLGVRTLSLLRESSPIEMDERIKVSRKEVRTAMRRGLAAAFSNRMLRRTYERIRTPLPSS